MQSFNYSRFNQENDICCLLLVARCNKHPAPRISDFHLPPPFPVLSFYKLVSILEIGNLHIFSVPLIRNISARENIAFHFTINRIFPGYFLLNIKASQQQISHQNGLSKRSCITNEMENRPPHSRILQYMHRSIATSDHPYHL